MSDLRKTRDDVPGMNIENKLERDGETGAVLSFYRWTPDPSFPLGRQAHEFTQQPELF